VIHLQHLLASGGDGCPRRLIPIENISHVSVNCDDSLLAVVITRGDCPHALIFNCCHLLTEAVSIINTYIYNVI
jgi:hypothetical protein